LIDVNLPGKFMHITETTIVPMFLAFILVVALPLVSLLSAFFTDEPSQEAPSPRAPLMVDEAYPSTWLAPGWNRKYLRAPLSCDSLMELYTTSVRYIRERDWNNAILFSERCLSVCQDKGLASTALEANILNNIGVIAFRSNVAKAEVNFLAALNIAQVLDEQVTIASTARNLAAVYLFKQELTAAKSALAISEAAIIGLYGANARELVDLTCLQIAIDRASGKRIGRR
jgi:hypothetical protein